MNDPTPTNMQAPTGVEPIAVYAQRDVHALRGGKSSGGEMEGGSLTVVHKRGFVQMLDPAIAREVVRLNPVCYAFTHPDGDIEAAVALAPPTVQDRLAAMLADQELVNALRLALAATEPAQPVAGVPVVQPPAVVTTPGQFVLTALPGVNEKVARALEDAKLGTLDQLRAATLEQIAAVPGVGNKLAERIAEHITKHHPKPKEG